MSRPRAETRAKAQADAAPGPLPRALWLLPALGLLALGLTLRPAWGSEHEGAETITSHGISVFGDLKYGPDFPHFDYVNPDAPLGGTMRFVGTGASTTFDSLNPFILKGVPAQGLGLLHDSLLVGSADEPASAYGLIAQSMEYPEDRSWVIFNMNPDARFSDGEPIEASDVVFTYNVLQEKGHPAYRISFQDFESVEALDTHRVKFAFREGASTRELIQQAGGISILPEHYYADVDFAESTMTPPVSSGGYVVRDAQPGQSITYCRNPDYWGWEHPVNVGANNFECIVYEYFADRTAGFEAFKAGQYYLHEEFTSKTWAVDYNFPAIERGWVKQEAIPDNRPSGTQGFWINLRRDKFQDPRVRQAIGLMFNFEWSNETLFYGLYERTDSFWENSPMQAEGLPEGAELALLEEYRDQLPERIFTEPAFTPAVNRPERTDRAAIRQASNLLEDAGWTIVDGIRKNAAGETLTVEVMDDSAAFERIINPFVENLKRIGIDARLTLVDPSQGQQRLKDRDYDLVPGRLVMSLTPGLELRQIFGSQSAMEPDTANYAGVSDPVVDALIQKVIQAESRDEMEVAVRALDRVLRDMHIWVPNWYKASHNVAYWDIFGRPEVKPPYARGDAYWWFDQEKYDALKAAGAPLR
ncbi:ABC transporter substrate-binding protein [Halovulum dunhuangense]|uniref:ABC transporter substrate-binding protein n=1 Tax=Halovulum dunhuangense TaxID=1505036 RepID=A0A849L550_9RHOB|nr:extracellular solute-binding protein [Halovulum dunhuangense]NNU81489.1 ABC transporter substrate-binding protein [Halovulum dunhuangense]